MGKSPPHVGKSPLGVRGGKRKKRGRKGEREKKEKEGKRKEEGKRRKGRENSKLKVFLKYSFWLGLRAR